MLRIVDDAGGTDIGALAAADTLEFVNLIAGARKPDGSYRALIEAVMAGRASGTNIVGHMAFLRSEKYKT
jgi:hypothetical protein